MDGWTFSDRRRLLAEALAAKDEDLIARVLFSDEFEPSLSARGGLTEIICVTGAEKRANRKRVEVLYAERQAIKARWAASA